MKLLWKAILLVVSTFSIFLLMSHLYLNRITTPFYLEKFVEELDVMEIVEKEIPQEYQMILNSEKFEEIVQDYTYSFGLYVLGENITYTISNEVEEELFKECYQLFLKDYPQFEFLPSSLFITFLVEKIDLNSYLPSFEVLKQQVPDEIIGIILLLKDERMFSIILLVMVALAMINRKILASGAFLNAILLFCLSIGSFIPFSFYEKGILLLLRELHVEIKYSIILAIGCMIFDWGIYYAKKIFLF